MKYLFYVEKPKKYSIEYSKDNGGGVYSHINFYIIIF